MISRLYHSFTLTCAIVSLVAILSACTPTVTNRGSFIDADKLEQIIVGESTREKVMDLLGSPTQVSTFDEKIWYYINRKTAQYSFLDPKVVAQKGVEIRFNEEGIVTKINEFDEKNAKDIALIDRQTTTIGRKTTFIEQLMGNIGRPGSLSKNK